MTAVLPSASAQRLVARGRRPAQLLAAARLAAERVPPGAGPPLDGQPPAVPADGGPQNAQSSPEGASPTPSAHPSHTSRPSRAGDAARPAAGAAAPAIGAPGGTERGAGTDAGWPHAALAARSARPSHRAHRTNAAGAARATERPEARPATPARPQAADYDAASDSSGLGAVEAASLLPALRTVDVSQAVRESPALTAPQPASGARPETPAAVQVVRPAPPLVTIGQIHVHVTEPKPAADPLALLAPYARGLTARGGAR